jgi:hypothetical protein
MVKTEKQRRALPPRELCAEETLVLFAVDSNSPPIDDDIFQSVFQNLTYDLPTNIWFGSWKVLRVPSLIIELPAREGDLPRLPPQVMDEMQAWIDKQAHLDALKLVRMHELTEVSAYAFVICVSEMESKPEPASFRIGDREIREGDSLSPEEAEEFIQALISQTPGPVTLAGTDESTGSTVSTRVEDWSDFVKGPETNAQARANHVASLQDKGYLAFEERTPGKLELRTPYRGLTRQYFIDFDSFTRCQDVPDRYLSLVSSGPVCFISHRWESLSHPDPKGNQFQIVKDFIRDNEPELIWYDFSCMPQQPRTAAQETAFRDSLRDLNSLVMMSQFVSIITEDYISRAWCYYEWIVSTLLPVEPRIDICRAGFDADYDPLISDLVLQGRHSELRVTDQRDMPYIQELLRAGVELFKTLALAVTLSVLNKFGFDFGVGIASRFAPQIDFAQLWMIWQMLAGSSMHSGIKLPDLIKKDRLERILEDRHEDFGTHARIYQGLPELSKTQLDLRIVEQRSQDHLLNLLAEARRLGPVPAAYTTLALLQLVYSFAAAPKQ